MSDDSESEQDARGVELTVRSASAFLAAAIALHDPSLGVAAAAALPALDIASARAGDAVRHRMAAVLGTAAREASLHPNDFIERITDNPHKVTLLMDALRAGAETAWEEQIRVLGHALATGAIAEDDAIVDEERRWIAILAMVEAPELRILEYLLRNDSERPGHMIIARREALAEASGYRKLIGPALIAMERNALVRQERGSDQDQQTRARWSLTESTVIYKRGELTKVCYQRFLDVGVHVP